MREPIKLHHNEIQKEQKSSDETQNLENNCYFLIVQAFGPKVNRVAQNLKESTHRTNNKHNLEPTLNINSNGLRNTFVRKSVRIAVLFTKAHEIDVEYCCRDEDQI